MRVSIYARYSSDKQREASIEDQVRLCEERAAREGWRVVKHYTDHAISGASLIRPGIQALMQDAQGGKFDVVLTESLDRISRDQEDIAGVYKRLRFAGVKIHTLSEGEIAELHIGFTGTMSALYLKSLGEKTWRGQSGRVRAGKSGGGNCYGYDVVRGPEERERTRARWALYQRKRGRDRLLHIQSVRGREITQSDRACAEPEEGSRPYGQGLGTVHNQWQLATRHRHPKQRALYRPSGLE
jgi:DNA invertase Pin-like site-specific DNA recombinase